MRHLSCLFLLISALFLSNQTSNAQVEVGLKGGLNMSAWDWSTGLKLSEVDFGDITDGTTSAYGDLEDAKYKPGFHVGAYAMFDLGFFTIMPEVLYSQKGSKNFTTEADLVTPLSAHLHYVSVPIMFGLQPFDAFHIQFGPQFGYLAAAKYKSDNQNAKVNDFYESFEIGLGIGVMFDWSGRANIGLRYTHGLGALQEYTPAGLTESLKLQNRTLQLSVGVPLYAPERRNKKVDIED